MEGVVFGRGGGGRKGIMFGRERRGWEREGIILTGGDGGGAFGRGRMSRGEGNRV